MPTSSDTKPTSFEDAFRVFVEDSLRRSGSAVKADSSGGGCSGRGQVNGAGADSASSGADDTGQTADPEAGSSAADDAATPKATSSLPHEPGPMKKADSLDDATGDAVSGGSAAAAGASQSEETGSALAHGRGGQKRALFGSGEASEASGADAEGQPDNSATGQPPAKRARGRGRGRMTAPPPCGESSSDVHSNGDSNQGDVVGRRRSSRRSRAIDFSSQLADHVDEDDPAAADMPGASDGSVSDEWTPKRERTADEGGSSGDEIRTERRCSPTERVRRGRSAGRRSRLRRTGTGLGRTGAGLGRTIVTRYQLPKEVEEAVHGTKPPPETPLAGATTDEKPPTTGDFIIAVEDINMDRPPIWRIDGKFLIQKYEAIRGKRQRLYKNMATYMSWAASCDKFRPVSVRYHQMGRTEIIVELLDNPHSASFNRVKAQSVEATSKYLENFEIYMQTVISQALDANFLLEVMEEGDEYFMKNVNIIKRLNEERKQKILELKSWDEETQSEMERLPCLELVLLRNVPPSECAMCREVANPRMVQLYGRPYDPVSLQSAGPHNASNARKQYSMCSFCAGLADLYHKLVHQMFHLYLRSCEQVTIRRKEAPDQDSTRILNVILADEAWLAKMFGEVQVVWGDIDQLYTAAKQEDEETKQSVHSEDSKDSEPAKRS